MNEDHLARVQAIAEAALLAAGKPLSLEQLRELFVEDERPSRQVMEHVLVQLDKACEGRGFELKKVASGYRLQVREELAPWVGRLFEEKPQRYSRALLETLALIAYRQPITRGEIEDIRGVTVSSNIIRTLLEREWVRVVGHRDVPGRPAMYATTRQFLDYFNLTGLDELPPLSEVRDLEEIGREIERNIQGEIQFESSQNDSSNDPGQPGGNQAAESEQTLH
ncbi:SMC-Scp complex subunit ScpB [Marinobacter shengliensis]